ncbi:MAG TPA: polysaccharide biosynthesis/export family protein [Patescibacteria group bacterium]|nr:polysaccharide biosynthesis/export family protein [Patescibacteria group bacterium]
MKKILLLSLFLLLPLHAQAADYVLSPRDVLNISVYGYTDLSFTDINIRPDGKFEYPLVGQVDTSGLSPEGVAGVLTERLSAYIKNPQVSVNVSKFRTIQVVVLGEVNKPGTYELDRARTMLDAVGFAGGWTKDAAKKKVYLIRKGQQEEPIKVNLLQILKKGDVSQNYVLSEGDVVYLSENGRIDVAKDIVPYLSTGYMIRKW